MTDLAAARRTMVENQLRTYDVFDQVLLAAFETVPREAFVAEGQSATAYLDRPVRARDGRSWLMTPMVTARMMQALELNVGEKVLDVGGAGYGAAILKAMGVEAIALEREPAVAQAALEKAGLGDIRVHAGDLAAGLPAAGPYDAIMVHGASDGEPTALLDQLKDDGALAIVMGRGRSGRVMIFKRVGNRFSRARSFDAAAPLLPEFERKPEFSF